LIAAFIAGLACETLAVEPHVFDALYLIVGRVSAGGAPGGLTGRKVVFYQSYPTTVAVTLTTDRYALNIYDNSQVQINPSNTYYVAVEKGADGWGADPVTVNLRPEGWNEVNLTLAAGAGPGGTTEGPDDGQINNTTIERLSDGRIKLTWSYNGIPPGAQVWKMRAGADSQFSNTVTAYSGIWTGTGTEHIDPAFTGSAYYRVVPGGVTQPDIFGNAPGGQPYNKRTMGKVDITLGQEYNSIGYPFNANYIGVADLMGNQLAEGDQIHWWDQPAQSYRLITRPAGGWPTGHNFEFGDGFFVYIVPATPPTPPRTPTLTMVGLVGNFAAGVKKNLEQQYNLIGYPYPVIRSAVDAGFAAREGDQIHKWNQPGQGFTMTTFVGASWSDLGLTNFSVGEGKFYYIPTTGTAYDWMLRY
jgi:hypothetical protein